jgi:hypothetical protein
MTDQNDELTPGEKQLLQEVAVTGMALDVFYSEWLDHYYGGEEQAPDAPRPYQDAQWVVAASDDELAAEGITEETYGKAYTFLHALDKYDQALETLKAEFSYAHPEHLGELNQRLDEIHGEEDPPETP